MLIRRAPSIKTSEITDEPLYRGRREFIRTAGSVAAAALLPFGRVPTTSSPERTRTSSRRGRT
jgi:hypothetical protein